ncbi:uncharacterized protein LOC122258590 isoform X2 [Penaeus japonicus]|uniref:uncharacterized protein LOC122258590 isoform X2 n=1 Tax=Penaeus japonicus TaxID=27405 RepID=UPI001C715F5C|nr:uncharacterized protein LOC122258590 isoform X2 [Penaeus japonicus]
MPVQKALMIAVILSLMTKAVKSDAVDSSQHSAFRIPGNFEDRQLPSILGVISPESMPVYFSFIIIGASIIVTFLITAVLANQNSLQGRDLDLSRDLRDLTWTVYTALSKP